VGAVFNFPTTNCKKKTGKEGGRGRPVVLVMIAVSRKQKEGQRK
jgi:hypothetical protein